MYKSITLMALFSVSLAEKTYIHASADHVHGHKKAAAQSAFLKPVTDDDITRLVV